MVAFNSTVTQLTLSLGSHACPQLFWNDGTFTTDGMLNAWEPGCVFWGRRLEQAAFNGQSHSGPRC